MNIETDEKAAGLGAASRYIESLTVRRAMNLL